MQTALERASKHLTGPWQKQIDWIDEQINRLWKLRGPCPGLGSALSALDDGFNGTLFALTLSASLSGNRRPLGDHGQNIPKKLSAPSGAPKLTAMLRKRWEHLHKEASKLAALLRLLSRFELTWDQAVRWFEKKDLTDAVLENPISFTSAIDRICPIGLWTTIAHFLG